jgi:hypothetical protein
MQMLFKLFGQKKPTPRSSPASRSRSQETLAPQSEADWSHTRSPEGFHDTVLLNHTSAWVDSLPSRLRPVQLTKNCPRLANRFALCWSDVALTSALFDTLMTDKRGNRKGFPPVLAAELLRLHELHGERVGTSSGPSSKARSATRQFVSQYASESRHAWEPHTQTPSDR